MTCSTRVALSGADAIPPTQTLDLDAARQCQDMTLSRFLPMIAAVVFLAVSPTLLPAQEFWSMRDASATLMIFHDALEENDVFISDAETAASPYDRLSRLELAIGDGTDLSFTVVDGSVTDVFGSDLELDGGIAVLSHTRRQTVFRLNVTEIENARSERLPHGKRRMFGPALSLYGMKVGFDRRLERITLVGRDVRMSPALAEGFGRSELALIPLGTVVIRGACEWIGGDEPQPLGDTAMTQPGSTGGIGPDVSFCQLYGLRQGRPGDPARLGDVVGLTVATTSWNLGDEELDWYGRPDSRHPFIIFNLLRIKDDRIEMIGESWVKHGFCALDNSQCTTHCDVPTGCQTLSPGCTDTYSASLNASQSGLGPKSEVNPWTGAWSYEGSHFSGGSHSHDAIQHRLQVHDSDLDPSQNPGATYVVESFYNCHDDVDPMNSAAWKPASIVSGEPGGFWVFGISGSGTMPEIGFGINAWSGARQTVLAEEVPPVRFASPDGRCVLAAKATDLGTGMWHYEYAVMNVDMDRKVRSFSIPLMPGLTVENVGFHAVEHHDEPAYSNTPWTATVGDGACTWTTVDNPLRWGALYNFRFDTNAPPGDATVTLGLFEPGLPEAVSGTTTGPVSQGPTIVYNSANVQFTDQAFSGYIDPRMESSNGDDLDRGVSEITLHFSERVGNIAGGTLTAAAFSVRQTGEGTPPQVSAISTSDNQTVTVILNRIITLGEWTTIEAAVRNMAGNPIINRGDLGPGVSEPDRVDIGFLPGDVDQNGVVQPLDLLRFRQMLTGVLVPTVGDVTDYVDTDRSGSIAPLDLLRFRQLYYGTGQATTDWGGRSMNHEQP